MSKKEYKDIPALAFFDDPTADDTPAIEEKKTKRLNMLTTPSLAADLVKIAHMKQTSVNALVNHIMTEYRDAQADTLTRYDEVFGKE